MKEAHPLRDIDGDLQAKLPRDLDVFSVEELRREVRDTEKEENIQ